MPTCKRATKPPVRGSPTPQSPASAAPPGPASASAVRAGRTGRRRCRRRQHEPQCGHPVQENHEAHAGGGVSQDQDQPAQDEELHPATQSLSVGADPRTSGSPGDAMRGRSGAGDRRPVSGPINSPDIARRFEVGLAFPVISPAIFAHMPQRPGCGLEQYSVIMPPCGINRPHRNNEGVSSRGTFSLPSLCLRFVGGECPQTRKAQRRTLE